MVCIDPGLVELRSAGIAACRNFGPLELRLAGTVTGLHSFLKGHL
jgi:hypothetical protein